MDFKKIMSIGIKTPEKPGEDFMVSVNRMEFRAKTQTGVITLALDYLGEAATKENIAQFIEIATIGVIPSEVYLTDNLRVNPDNLRVNPDNLRVNPDKKSKGKVGKKPKPENELIGKVFLGKKGELFRLVAVTPPGDWQFELECLDTDNRGGTKRLGIKEFKELTELVPKQSRRKEGK